MKSDVRFASNFVAVVVGCSVKSGLLARNHIKVHNNALINLSIKNTWSN